MCDNCKSLTIPTGETGTSGADGTNGTNGINGDPGTNGTNGTNAFKFIKEFASFLDGEVITITKAQLISCGALPIGCMWSNITSTNVDFVIDLYILPAGQTSWNRISSLSGISININNSTGLISITLGLPPTDELARVRVVIIG